MTHEEYYQNLVEGRYEQIEQETEKVWMVVLNERELLFSSSDYTEAYQAYINSEEEDNVEFGWVNENDFDQRNFSKTYKYFNNAK